MGYSIAEVSEKTHLTPHTLRYYEKEGLLPFVERSDSGNRNFKEEDLEMLELICCLKNTGMPLKKIKDYIQLCIQGNSTVEIRREIFLKHREDVLNQMAELQKNLDKINCKIDHYDSVYNKYRQVIQRAAK
ncbi:MULTISPECIES: MerR family transcriptional regulator [unclassified Clostridium]|uniref:MerR family transcriptional regulator n=1 Tax=unclassified Clostridium TaxID=2614128 RepID=UPI00023B04A2|nr:MULTISPECIES: MerR family transcriptional regulator [unclassified Clostridium]EHJ01921.1 transcriptional regulator, MerR family [Clostridium sp. DL-VIII]OOM70046.1 HTH-type transcriptional regulator AdhR [Clostridium sp. BL-8]